MANGSAAKKDITQTTAMIRTALFNPDMAYEWRGWQMAKYLSIENATMVKTDVYEVLYRL